MVQKVVGEDFLFAWDARKFLYFFLVVPFKDWKKRRKGRKKLLKLKIRYANFLPRCETFLHAYRRFFFPFGGCLKIFILSVVLAKWLKCAKLTLLKRYGSRWRNIFLRLINFYWIAVKNFSCWMGLFFFCTFQMPTTTRCRHIKCKL